MNANTLQRGKDIHALWQALDIVNEQIFNAIEHCEQACAAGDMEPDELRAECNMCNNECDRERIGTTCRHCGRGVFDPKYIIYPENAAPELDEAAALLVSAWMSLAEQNPEAEQEARRLRELDQ